MLSGQSRQQAKKSQVGALELESQIWSLAPTSAQRAFYAAAPMAQLVGFLPPTWDLPPPSFGLAQSGPATSFHVQSHSFTKSTRTEGKQRGFHNLNRSPPMVLVLVVSFLCNLFLKQANYKSTRSLVSVGLCLSTYTSSFELTHGSLV